ncbi:DUF2493 domain-containing protein [Ferrimonas balearica]|uniref:DUF2493 domain-containing protein n=1 Tax=Ferrimonas balearica TaxID=44012 RepID=UPI001F3522DA|nr:DUF2493 domain-containing protein [Ferrimonas balearica]MBY6093868.1 DUF2493 domain-containing protein [Ferrimonas balearica]
MSTEFRVIVAGSRTYSDYDSLKSKLDLILAEKLKDHRVVIIDGGAPGPDRLGRRYAQERGLAVETYPAEWDTHGKKAGILRNLEMANVADALVAFWDSASRGTAHMIQTMEKQGKPVRVIKF